MANRRGQQAARIGGGLSPGLGRAEVMKATFFRHGFIAQKRGLLRGVGASNLCEKGCELKVSEAR